MVCTCSSCPFTLKFIYEGQEYNTIRELEDNLSGSIYADDQSKVKALTIDWKWDYETGSNQNEITKNDEIDTQDAQDIATYQFNVVVSGTQMEPQI